MPGKDLPLDPPSFVQGLDYMSGPALTDDAADTSSVSSGNVPESMNPTEPPVQAMGSDSKVMDAPGNPHRWNSGTKEPDLYMEGSTLPWER